MHPVDKNFDTSISGHPLYLQKKLVLTFLPAKYFKNKSKNATY